VDPAELPAALEAILFASGEPIGIERLSEATGLDKERLLRALRDLEERTAADPRRGLMVREADGSWFLSTKPSVVEPLRRLFQPRTRSPLSQAAYETLAIIAYNQPATRAQVENVRGVGSDSIVARLIERGLVREAGTLDAPGRPTLFETTEQFLQEFGLRSVHDLPSMEMMMYGTLREIEVQLEEAAGNRTDNQITIEQIAPGLGEGSPVPVESYPAPDPEEMLDLSGALFGEDGDPA
jgi:segregation and condensation protein B